MTDWQAGGRELWSEDLTDAQLSMIMESGADERDGQGFGVELRGGGWATARALVRKRLGWIEGDPGGELPGLYFNNREGARITACHGGCRSD